MIIGITGTDGSGKGTVVDYLVRYHGYTHYSSRDFIIIEIERLGLPLDRSQMRLTANALRAEFGNDVIVKKAYARAQTEEKNKIVIESIRALAEAEYLLSQGGILLAVDASPEVRYIRVQERRSASDQVSYEQFLAHEKLEYNDPDPHGMQKGKVMELASHTFMNNESKKDLNMAVDSWLAAQ